MLKIKRSIQSEYIAARLEVSQERGSRRTRRWQFLFLAFSAYRFCPDQYQSVDIISQEMCSLFAGIEVQRTKLSYVPVTRSYSNCAPTQHPYLNSCNRARSTCILEIVANRPWATLVDVQIFPEGWDMGEKWVSQKHT